VVVRTEEDLGVLLAAGALEHDPAVLELSEESVTGAAELSAPRHTTIRAGRLSVAMACSVPVAAAPLGRSNSIHRAIPCRSSYRCQISLSISKMPSK
jgi:hypothetical protein